MKNKELRLMEISQMQQAIELSKVMVGCITKLKVIIPRLDEKDREAVLRELEADQKEMSEVIKENQGALV